MAYLVYKLILASHKIFVFAMLMA